MIFQLYKRFLKKLNQQRLNKCDYVFFYDVLKSIVFLTRIETQNRPYTRMCLPNPERNDVLSTRTWQGMVSFLLNFYILIEMDVTQEIKFFNFTDFHIYWRIPFIKNFTLQYTTLICHWVKYKLRFLYFWNRTWTMTNIVRW